jgi:hypothetical protein
VSISAPREQLLKAEMPNDQTSSAEQAQRVEPQQWIVFTEWAQVQTPATSGAIADYNTGSDAAGAPEPAASQRGDAGRITITRMILRVYPVASPSNSARSSDSAPHTGTNPVSKSVFHQSAAVPFGDGWLVIQL